MKSSRRKTEEHCVGAKRSSNCVKVNMEGIAIGRKLDLSLHDSYEDLFHALNLMFPKKQNGEFASVY